MEALRNLKYIKDNRANFVEWNQQQKTKEAKVSVLINKKNFTTFFTTFYHCALPS